MKKKSKELDIIKMYYIVFEDNKENRKVQYFTDDTEADIKALRIDRDPNHAIVTRGQCYLRPEQLKEIDM